MITISEVELPNIERRVTLGMSSQDFESQKEGDFYEVVCKTCKPESLSGKWQERDKWLLLSFKDPKTHVRNHDYSYPLAIAKINEHLKIPENIGHTIEFSKSNRRLVDMLAYEHDHPVEHPTALPRIKHKG